MILKKWKSTNWQTVISFLYFITVLYLTPVFNSLFYSLIELNESPKSANFINRNNNKVISSSNPLDSQSPNINTGPSPHIPYHTPPPFALSNTSHDKVCSAGSTGSGPSALAKALSAASLRLLGMGSSPPSWSERYSKQKENITMFPPDSTLDPAEVIIPIIYNK